MRFRPAPRGTVAGDALHVHPDLHAAPVTPVDAAVGGLGGYHELRGEAVFVVDVLPAQAVAILLLDGGRHQHGHVRGDQAQVLHDLGAVYRGDDAAFLVGTAPAADLGFGLKAA